MISVLQLRFNVSFKILLEVITYFDNFSWSSSFTVVIQVFFIS